MGNVPPRGLYGYPKEGTGSTPAPANAVFVARSDGTWCAASEVWQFCEDIPGTGTWIPVWVVVPRQATAATATRLGGGPGGGPISVKVDWTLPNPTTADSWRIVRPDGTIAGVTAYNATTFTDTDPRPAPTGAAYKVVPLNAGVAGPERLTNTVVLGAAPPATSAALGVNWRVELGPGGAISANSTAYRFYRPGAALPYWEGSTSPAGPWLDEFPNPGQVGQYKVCAMVNNREGACSLFPSVTTRPAPPQIQWWNRGSTGGVDGRVSLGFYGPAQGGASDYHVQIFANNAWRDLGYGYLSGVVGDYNVQVWGGGGYVTGVQWRVATRLNGVESDWAYSGSYNAYAPPQQPSVGAFNHGAMQMGIYGNRPGGGPPVQHWQVQVYDDTPGNNSGCSPNVWCHIGNFADAGTHTSPYPIYYVTRGAAVYVSVSLVGPGGTGPSAQAGPVDMRP